MVGVGNISDVITSQYPHFLYKRVSTEAVQNAHGSWEGGGAEVVFCGACREETNGRGAKIQTADGLFREFSAEVFMPAAARHMAEGTGVFVLNRETADPARLLDGGFLERGKATGLVRISGEVMKFDNGRLHKRLWV